MENYIVINGEYYAPIEMEKNYLIQCPTECDLWNKCGGKTLLCNSYENVTNLHNILFKKIKVHN